MAGSPDRFGYEWDTYSQIRPESGEQLERWLGPIRLSSFKGLSVLDVGCGMGRNPYWMLKAGAASVTAVDVDERSLAAAARNLSSFPNSRVIRNSAYELNPDRLGYFDRVTCIGVLHHLSDPHTALMKMWRCVLPGGDLVLWCYGRSGNRLFLPMIQFLRFFGSRLPLPITRAMAVLATMIAYPVFKCFPWKTIYYRNLKQLPFWSLETIIFNQFLPKIAHY